MFKKPELIRNLKKYDCIIVSDNLSEGFVMTPGIAFTKIWTVRNTGYSYWPSGTTLERYDYNYNMPSQRIYNVGALKPNQEK